jgi:hypothetical protein
MDYHRLNDLLDEEAYYENMKKTAFIYKQMQIFKELRANRGTRIFFFPQISAQVVFVANPLLYSLEMILVTNMPSM